MAHCVLSWLFCFTISDSIAPLNEHLADSPWPVAHHDSYSQASVRHAGISKDDVLLGRVEADYLFDPSVAGTLSVYWTDWNSSIAWGSSLRAIYKVDTSTTPMKILDAVKKPSALMSNDTFRGIYSVVSDEGVFYTSLGNTIVAATHETGANGQRDVRNPIRALGSFVLDRRLLGNEEGIISLNMLYSGHLAFLTDGGLVGVISKNLKRVLAMSSLAYSPKFEHQLKDNNQSNGTLPDTKGFYPLTLLEVSNAMTVDHMGGMYIVSSRFMHRMIFDPQSERLIAEWPCRRAMGRATEADDQTPLGVLIASRGSVYKEQLPLDRRPWTRYYATEPLPNRYRLSRVGSGSSPSLFKHPADNRLYVTITDGMYIQSLNVFDAQEGQLVAEAPVDFGIPDFAEESYTEQSVLVNGAEMVVVQNGLTSTAKKLNAAFHHWDAAHLLAEYRAPSRLSRHMWLAPVALGDAPRGVQKFALEIDEKNQSKLALKSIWATLEYGCPNSIPAMSEATGLMYCVSKAARSRFADLSRIRDVAARGVISNLIGPDRPDPIASGPSQFARSSNGGPLPYPDGFEGIWTIAGIDWQTGQKIFDVRTGGDLRFNSLYAATQVGPYRQMIYGCLGGIVRIRPVPISLEKEN